MQKNAYICTTCGTQYPPADKHPETCPICCEERQFVLTTGQNWTTLPKMRVSHSAIFKQESDILAIGCAPFFAIGQRALLVRTPQGNILWDCISLLDDAMIEIINALGGLKAIAISHPHYYTTMLEWSRAFGGVPIYLNENDRQWVMQGGPEIEFWDGDTREIGSGLTLIRTGGHFAGGAALHWADGASGKGALLSGDLLQVNADRKTVSFMWSYPNFIPLGEVAVRQIADRIEPFQFDKIYGAFWDRVIEKDAKSVVEFSVNRHIEMLHRKGD